MDAPSSFIPRARYALRMMLMPLGVEPVWVSPAEVGNGLYYGISPGAACREAHVIELLPATVQYFDSNRRYDPSQIVWIAEGNDRIPVLFRSGDQAGIDLVASFFFWVSGWQEGTIRERDEYGRFPYAASLQGHLDLSDFPIADAYREIMGNQLRQRGCLLQRRTWHGRTWALCPSHDIDYLRRWRPGPLLGEISRHFLMNTRRVSPGERARRLGAVLREASVQRDSYRACLERFHAEERARGVRATYFIKTNAHDNRDIPYDSDGSYLRERIGLLEEEGFEIGLHPSYQAHAHPGYMSDERRRLERILSQPPVSVRQHYLRYSTPATPRLQLASGFLLDSTLAFAEREGFRNATCLPFQIFDREANRALDLWEMPLSLMDSTLYGYRSMEVPEAIRTTERILERCRRFGGVCVALWHNILYDSIDRIGWERHFEETLEAGLRSGAYVGSLRDAFAGWSE